MWVMYRVARFMSCVSFSYALKSVRLSLSDIRDGRVPWFMPLSFSVELCAIPPPSPPALSVIYDTQKYRWCNLSSVFLKLCSADHRWSARWSVVVCRWFWGEKALQELYQPLNKYTHIHVCVKTAFVGWSSAGSRRISYFITSCPSIIISENSLN
jgi:hypothetical protein